MGGNFNVTRFLFEKSCSSNLTRSMRIFDEHIKELKLVNPPLHNVKFRWSNFNDSPICCRLDRFLFSEGWWENFLFGRQEAIVRVVSNLCPILFDTNPPKWGLLHLDSTTFGLKIRN